MKILLFLVFGVHLAAAVTHTLQVFYTGVTPGINFPEFTALSQLDGVQYEYYDSKIRKKIPKTEWIKKIDADDPHYWNTYTQVLQENEEIFKFNVDTLMQRFNHTTGVHTVQVMYGCERDYDGTIKGYSQYGYDGEDYLSFDLRTLTWIAPTPQALITKNKWENYPGYNIQWKNYLEKECIEWINRHLSYGKETLERKVRPTASVFQKHSSSPEVVCHATGFFPKTVNITWQKDGEDVHEDVELRETLPNQDGSFQKRSILTVSAEDLQKHTYTCVIQHSSLEKEIVLPVSERQILNPELGSDGGSDGGSGGGSDGGSGGGSDGGSGGGSASLFQEEAASPEVVCHATGFFPKTVMITWQDGEDVHEDVDLRKTLPNQDGSFQKRIILTVSAEDLQKHTYTCVIQHSSLGKEIVLPVSERRILNPELGSDGGSDGGSGGAPISIIVAVVVALVALVVIVGTVVRKNNNSGFSSVPPTSTTSSEGDSSSKYS
ncbi:BOLA class I histocompatibility antigen, alpha chain BL3-7 isoform X2 [Ictalurus furcatus]|uniref:BOLA class I histocompatibility antigen, alpha chain BL3-7 isoform X2 n=1 Tax=Ictalurus furcatus TaxID=66913 RepID=UPI00234FD510|nr:BOLA class I histocompatibility antigen, alpha chain BL3-7 isoform X2 [Ictalurus furcatus]